jgi:OFA family oxalate/formate antiporter-like MFS transporter
LNKKPTFYYGYVVVVASALIMLVGWGTYYCYGLFFDSLLTEFGWTRAVTSGVFSVSILISGLMGIVTGKMSDRLGPKALSIFCCICLGTGFILMSMVNSVWQAYLLYALPIAVGVGGLWSPIVSTVARWFVGNRGLMTGIVVAGIGVGNVILSPLVSQFISAYGWRFTYIILGIIVLLVILVSAQFLRRDPEQIGLLPYGDKLVQKASMPVDKDFSFQGAIRTRQFWLVAVLYFLFGYSQVTIMVHIVPYATGLGMPHITAAGILATIGAASIFGRIIMGGMSDRIRVKPSLIFVLVLLLLSLSWLGFAEELWQFYLFSIVFGFAWGGLSSLQPLASAQLFGLTSLGVIAGCFSFSFCFGGTFGPTVSGYIFDVWGSYKLVFLICAITALATLISTLWLTSPRISREIKEPSTSNQLIR